MKKVIFAVLAFVGFCFAQDMGTISPDTLIPARTVIQPAQLTGAFYEYTYSGDSVSKYGDRFRLSLKVNRGGAGTSVFDSNIVLIQPKTRGIDTLNNRRGFIWRVRFELLPR